MLFPVFVIESKLLFTDKVSILINNKKRWRRNMPKGKTTVFFCQECGYESSKWMGQCPACKDLLFGKYNHFRVNILRMSPIRH